MTGSDVTVTFNPWGGPPRVPGRHHRRHERHHGHGGPPAPVAGPPGMPAPYGGYGYGYAGPPAFSPGFGYRPDGSAGYPGIPPVYTGAPYGGPGGFVPQPVWPGAHVHPAPPAIPRPYYLPSYGDASLPLSIPNNTLDFANGINNTMFDTNLLMYGPTGGGPDGPSGMPPVVGGPSSGQINNLLQALQRQSQQIDQLNGTISQLRGDLAAAQARIQALEARRPDGGASVPPSGGAAAPPPGGAAAPPPGGAAAPPPGGAAAPPPGGAAAPPGTAVVPTTSINTSQPTACMVRPVIANYGHFENAAGIPTTDARWSDAPVTNTGVILRNTVTGGLNMVGNGACILVGRGWLWD